MATPPMKLFEETVIIPPTGAGPCEFNVTYAPGRPIQSATFYGTKASVLKDGSLAIYGIVEWDDSLFGHESPVVIIPAGQYLQCRMVSYKRKVWVPA